MNIVTLIARTITLANLVVLCGARPADAQGIPTANPLTYSGVAYENNQPALAGRSVEVTVLSNGTTLCMSTATTLAGGRFSAPFPSSCVSAIESNNNVEVAVSLGGTSLGQAAVSAAPYAVEAKNAQSAVDATNASNAAGALATTISALQSRLSIVEANAIIGTAHASGTGSVMRTTSGDVALPGRVLAYTKVSSTSRLRLLYKDNVGLYKTTNSQPKATVYVRVNGQDCQDRIAGIKDINHQGQVRGTIVAMGMCERLSGTASLPAGTYSITAHLMSDVPGDGDWVEVNNQMAAVPWYLEVQEVP